MDDSYADAHKDTIFEALAGAIRAKTPAFCGLLDEIEAWTWVGEVYCLIPNTESLFADRLRSNQPFAALVRNFGYRHGIHIELRSPVPLVCRAATDFREPMMANHRIPNHLSGEKHPSCERVNTILPQWNCVALIKRLSHRSSA